MTVQGVMVWGGAGLTEMGWLAGLVTSLEATRGVSSTCCPLDLIPISESSAA